MEVLSQVVAYVGLLIETVILVRAMQCKNFAKYSIFYTYLLTVLVTSVFLQIAYHTVSKPVYGRLYWPLDLVTLALGCGVIVEIPGHVFARHVSLKRFTRWGAINPVRGVSLAFGVKVGLLPQWKGDANQAELEREL